MAYISTDDVKHIRNELKKELPQYKFSVVRDHHSSVTISLMKTLPSKTLNTLTDTHMRLKLVL